MSETLYRLKPLEWTEKTGVATAWNTTHRHWTAPAGGFESVLIFEDSFDDEGKWHPYCWLAHFSPLCTKKHGCQTLEDAKAGAAAWAEHHLANRVLPLFEPVAQ